MVDIFFWQVWQACWGGLGLLAQAALLIQKFCDHTIKHTTTLTQMKRVVNIYSMKGLSSETGRKWVTILVNIIMVIITLFQKISRIGASRGRAKAKTHIKEISIPGTSTIVSIMAPLLTISNSNLIYEQVPEVQTSSVRAYSKFWQSHWRWSMQPRSQQKVLRLELGSQPVNFYLSLGESQDSKNSEILWTSQGKFLRLNFWAMLRLPGRLQQHLPSQETQSKDLSKSGKAILPLREGQVISGVQIEQSSKLISIGIVLILPQSAGFHWSRGSYHVRRKTHLMTTDEVISETSWRAVTARLVWTQTQESLGQPSGLQLVIMVSLIFWQLFFSLYQLLAQSYHPALMTTRHNSSSTPIIIN